MWSTIKHLLILLAVIGLLAAAVVVTVNNSNTTGFEPSYGESQHQFTSGEQTGVRPAYQGGHHEREGNSVFGAMELLKNLGIISIITAVVVLLEKATGWIKRFRKTPASLT
jgi:hypothetical protein